MQFSELFAPAFSMVNVEGRSKKRLFETVARHAAMQVASADSDIIFNALIDRERLGSTGLGEGVAVPHCRLGSAISKTIGMVIQLNSPINFDAPDQKPVDLLVFLLVAGEAAQEHLDVLAHIAGRLRDAEIRACLRQACSAEDLSRLIIGDSVEE